MTGVNFWKSLFRRGIKVSPDRHRETATLMTAVSWSRYCVEQNLDLFPEHSLPVTFCAWYAIPAFMALKFQGVGPEIPEGELSPLAAALGSAAIVHMTGLQPEDPDVADLHAEVKENIAKFTAFWLAAFHDVKPSYLRSEKILRAMLAGLIRNPKYDLQDTLALPDDDEIDHFSASVAGLIRHCYDERARLS